MSHLPEHAQRLVAARPVLLANLDASLLGPLADTLVSHGLLTAEEEEALLVTRCGEPRSSKWRRALALLAAKPPRAFLLFRGLVAEQQPGLVRAMDAARVLPYRPEAERRWAEAVRLVLGSETATRLWRMLARWLELEEAAIGAIEAGEPRDAAGQCAEALHRWRDATGQRAGIDAQLEALEQALRRLEITAVAEDVARV